ncbi:MAG: DUF1571 domain-containing protein [Gemmataceae bacterium]
MTHGSRAWRYKATGLLAAALAIALQGPLASQEIKKVAASALDQPLGILYEARKAYAGVRDYSATLVKRESLATNSEDNIIQFKFRQAPYSVYMRWLSPSKFKGQEVAYVHGQNRNKLRVHAKGLLKGMAGFVSIDVDDARIRECTRHNIYEAGIGFLIEKTIKHWEQERVIGRTEVHMAEYEYNKKRCYRIETTRTERRPEYYCYRTVIYVDQESKLPIRAENYNWPRPGGPAEGDLIEMFSYVDLRLNAGLGDRDFDK